MKKFNEHHWCCERRHHVKPCPSIHGENRCNLGPFVASDKDCLPVNAPAYAPAYGYVFNFPIQLVASGDEVNFSGNGPLFNIGHNPGSEAIFIPQEGDYLVEYTIAIEGNQASAYALILNGVEVPNAATRYGATSVGIIGQTMTGSVIISVPANSTLLLRNIGITADILIGFEDGQGVLNASLSIHKLSV